MVTEPRASITIKLKPYLQEYVRAELRSGIASKTNIIGQLIRPFVELRPADQDPMINPGPEYITIELPLYEDMNTRSNIWISPKNQATIECFLEAHFKTMFYNYMYDKVRFYKSFKKCILQFCADHNFTFDYINYEMLKKDFYRRRMEREIHLTEKKRMSGIVPELSLDCPRPGMGAEKEFTYAFLIR